MTRKQKKKRKGKGEREREAEMEKKKEGWKWKNERTTEWEKDLVYAILRAFFKGGNTQIHTEK